MSNQTEWRWADPTGQQRLVREDELRAAIASGVIPANAPVWTRGWSAWKPAHDVPELSGKASTNGDAQKPVATGPAEPPPPPRYVPFAAGSDTKVDAPVMRLGSDAVISAAPTAKATPPAKPKTTPPPLPTKTSQASAMKKSSAPPPLPPAARSATPTRADSEARKPTPAAMPAVKPQVQVSTAAQNLAKTAPSPGTTTKPIVSAKKPQQQQQSTFTKTERPPMGVAPPSEMLGPPSQSRSTLQIAVAPPPMPMPRLDPLPQSGPSQKDPSSKFPTLMGFGDEPGTVSGVAPPTTKPAPPSDDAPPIVVPPPEPSEVKNAVTRPPPWGEGAVQMDTAIPKSPKAPVVFPPTDPERPSEAPRPQELSSSDLTSEARIGVVKAPPLVAADRPRTMIGLGPDALAENRAALEKAVSPPPAPLSASDVASTKQLPAADVTEPKITNIPDPSGAKLHDLREIARERASGAVALLKRGYANLEERTKDKPRWVVATVLGAGTLVVIILFAVVIKAITGSSETSPVASGSSSATAHGSAQPTQTGTAKSPPARPIECSMTGASRSVAPKAVVSSGVEVTALASQLALGFAITPKEATLELLDPTSLAEQSALHLRSNDNVRRVVSVDASKAVVDVDRKSDKLQGRRTVRGATLIDLGAADGGLAWAPHGSDKAIKLWALANPDAPVEALRGEALPDGKGTAVAFRHAGAIWFGAFGGSPPAPLAGLIKVDGLGPVIGSPALAASGDRVMVAWADRATKDDPWMVRFATFKPGEDKAQAKPFPLPPGGLGDQVMSPSLASLRAGRFLIVWTEGAVSDHQVRGAVMGENGIIGDPFIASADGANAGQGQAAVNEAGRGVVAFLVGSKTFEIEATPIQCVER